MKKGAAMGATLGTHRVFGSKTLEGSLAVFVSMALCYTGECSVCEDMTKRGYVHFLTRTRDIYYFLYCSVGPTCGRPS
jgi:hypothetical protein